MNGKRAHTGTLHERSAVLFDLQSPDDALALGSDAETGHDWRLALAKVHEQALANRDTCPDARAMMAAWRKAEQAEANGDSDALAIVLFALGAAWQRMQTTSVAHVPWQAVT